MEQEIMSLLRLMAIILTIIMATLISILFAIPKKEGWWKRL
jgi:hypothetical protein